MDIEGIKHCCRQQAERCFWGAVEAGATGVFRKPYFTFILTVNLFVDTFF